MGLAKKIFMYTMLLVALCLAAVIIGAGYLVLAPNSTLFGYSFVMGNARALTEVIYENADTFESLNITTKNYKVYVDVIEPSEFTTSSVIEINMYRYSSAFTNSEIKEFNFEYIYNEEDNSYTINVIEPDKGIVFAADAYIEILIPHTNDNINVNVTSGGSNVYIGKKDSETNSGEEEVLVLNNLTITNGFAEFHI